MRLAQHVVVGIVSRCNLQTSRTKLDVHIAVLNDRDDTTNQWYDDLTAFQPLILGILRINTHRRVTHNGFRTCGGHYGIIALGIFMDNVTGFFKFSLIV